MTGRHACDIMFPGRLPPPPRRRESSQSPGGQPPTPPPPLGARLPTLVPLRRGRGRTSWALVEGHGWTLVQAADRCGVGPRGGQRLAHSQPAGEQRSWTFKPGLWSEVDSLKSTRQHWTPGTAWGQEPGHRCLPEPPWLPYHQGLSEIRVLGVCVELSVL